MGGELGIPNDDANSGAQKQQISGGDVPVGDGCWYGRSPPPAGGYIPEETEATQRGEKAGRIQVGANAWRRVRLTCGPGEERFAGR